MEMIEIFEYLKAIPDIPKAQWGKTFTVKCPCGGTMIVARVQGNGHLRAACKECGFNLIE